MRKKSLLVALFCGALCLTGCLKNYESESVTQVRNAKAEQLKAEAALLQAQASAETVLANAQAELIKAQADLVKAQADKVAAETAYQEVLNELAAVEVALKQVEVESARVELQKKKAELEAQQAQLEVAKAQAQKQLEEIARQLKAIQAAMEVDAVQQALALAQAEQALQDYLIKQKEDEVQAIMGIAFKYFDLQNKILEMEIDIFRNEVAISQLEAGIKDPNEALAEEIAKAQRELNRMEAIKAVAEKYLEYDEEEWKDVKAVCTAFLIEAQNELAEAIKAYNAALAEWDEAYDGVKNTYYYSYYDRDWYWWETFAQFNRALGADEEEAQDEDGNWFYQWGYYNENDEFVPFYTEQRSIYQVRYYYPDEETVKEAEEKGIILTSVYGDSYYKLVAGETDVEAYNAFIDNYMAEVNSEAEAEKQAAKAIADVLAQEYQEEFDAIAAKVDKTREYVEGLQDKFETADKALEDAEKDLEDANKAYEDAMEAVRVASINNAELEEAIAANFAAQEALEAASDEYNETRGATFGAQFNLVMQQFRFMSHYHGSDMATAEYNRDMAIARATNDKNVKEKAVTDAIVKAYEDAQAAYDQAKEAYATAQATRDAKLSVWRAAQIALAADPTNETLIKAEADAQIAYNTASADVTTKRNARNDARTARNNARSAYNAVNDPYEAAVQALEDLQTTADEYATRLEEATEAVALAEAAEETAKEAYEAAEEAVTAAAQALDDAAEALAAEEKAALEEAYDALVDAGVAKDEAEAAVEQLENTYRHYRQDAAALDEETGWLIELYNEAAERLEKLEYDYSGEGVEPYQDYIDAIDAEVKRIEGICDAAKERVAQYETQYRAAYVEAIEKYNEASESAIEKEFAYWAKDDEVAYYQEVISMIGACTFVDENGNVVSVEEYIAGINEKEEELVAGIIEKAQEIVDNNNDASIQIARLQNMNNHYQELIALYSALVEKYGEILQNFMDELAAAE